MCRSAARIFHMFFRHIEQGLCTRESNKVNRECFKPLHHGLPCHLNGWSLKTGLTVHQKVVSGVGLG